MYAAGNRGLSITSDGGQLHGAWSSDATVTTSDRRLKRNIEPLFRTLSSQAKSRWSQTEEFGGLSPSPTRQQDERAVNWLLRELRPVSFHMKEGTESKYLKFGFIAQELETVFPNLVRTVGKRDQVDDAKAIASQDLIAVLTLALQNMQKEVEQQRSELSDTRARLTQLERAVLYNMRSLNSTENATENATNSTAIVTSNSTAEVHV
jgi:hypothetical protein